MMIEQPNNDLYIRTRVETLRRSIVISKQVGGIAGVEIKSIIIVERRPLSSTASR